MGRESWVFQGAINLIFYKAYMTNNIKQWCWKMLKAEMVCKYHQISWYEINVLFANIIATHHCPLPLRGTSIYSFGGMNFPCHKLDRASAEVLFPQDVPKIIFIDADQAGKFTDFLQLERCVFGVVVGVVKYLIIFGRHTYYPAKACYICISTDRLFTEYVQCRWYLWNV